MNIRQVQEMRQIVQQAYCQATTIVQRFRFFYVDSLNPFAGSTIKYIDMGIAVDDQMTVSIS